ncbi:hypothetical protein AAE02nite_22920 [Adhaeribacter aerolatus]|uniref:Polysaccharide chain length determinant N-terminal domain-containing protein n=1 Tax=Adhaeribacter aerolatus TaxID=670289 RepID=A0A512AY34_9BACT|nr:Wzz/FepE/Etk N-terminal domain-containing protein [Adhaeribacter aerolatus]GEO04628.1 hypothetical protein AAE02nite_22920 [Adhaeribacter aerolatus]
MNNPEINNSKRNNSSEEEIDLNKLFNSVGKGISNFFKGLFRVFFLFLDTVTANLKIIGLLIIIGGILGLAYTFIARPYYESRMTLGSVYYRGQFINNSILSLDLLCKEKNFNAIANILQIPKPKAANLKSIQIEPIVSPSTQLLIDLYKETEGNKRRLDSLILSTEDTTFQIKVQVFDTTALNGLDTSIVNYILKNKFVKKRIEIERVNLKSRKAKLIKESASLDTLKRSIALSYRMPAAGRSGTNNVILDDKGTNPIDIYREDLRFYDQIIKIDRLLYINSELEIIDPFIAYGKSVNGSKVKNTLIGLLAGLILALLLIIAKVINTGLTKMKLILKREDNL